MKSRTWSQRPGKKSLSSNIDEKTDLYKPTAPPPLCRFLFCRRSSPAHWILRESCGLCVQVCTSLNVLHWYTFVFALLLYLCKLLLGQICRRCLCHRNLEVQKTARRSRVRQTDFASWSSPDKLWSLNVNKGIFYTFGFYLRSAGALGLTSPAPAGTSSFWRTKGHTVGVNLARGERFDS